MSTTLQTGLPRLNEGLLADKTTSVGLPPPLHKALKPTILSRRNRRHSFSFDELAPKIAISPKLNLKSFHSNISLPSKGSAPIGSSSPSWENDVQSNVNLCSEDRDPTPPLLNSKGLGMTGSRLSLNLTKLCKLETMQFEQPEALRSPKASSPADSRNSEDSQEEEPPLPPPFDHSAALEPFTMTQSLPEQVSSEIKSERDLPSRHLEEETNSGLDTAAPIQAQSRSSSDKSRDSSSSVIGTKEAAPQSPKDLRQSHSSFASDEGCYSGRSSSILKSSSVISDLGSGHGGRRGSWSNGFVGGSLHRTFRTHRAGYMTPPRTLQASIPVKPSFVGLRTYYAFGAKSMPTVDRWVKRQYHYPGSNHSFGFEKSYSASGSNWNLGRTASYEPKRFRNGSIESLHTHFTPMKKGRRGSDPSPEKHRKKTTRSCSPKTEPPKTSERDAMAIVERDEAQKRISRLALSTVPALAWLTASISYLISALKREISLLKEKLKRANEHNQRLENERLLLKRISAEARAQMEFKTDQVIEMRAKNDALALENEILRRKLEEAQSGRMYEEPRMRNLERQVEYLEGIIRDKENSERLLIGQLRALQEKHYGLNAAINNKAEQSSREVGSLTGQLTNANAEIAQLSTIRKRLEGQMASLQDEMESALLELKQSDKL